MERRADLAVAVIGLVVVEVAMEGCLCKSGMGKASGEDDVLLFFIINFMSFHENKNKHLKFGKRIRIKRGLIGLKLGVYSNDKKARLEDDRAIILLQSP